MHVHSAREDHGRAHDHVHGIAGARAGALAASVAGNLLIVLVEVAGGLAGHSLSLLSDAIHNLTDAPTLMISWLAARWAQRPPTSEKTYGYQRAGILAAFVNALVLAAVALFLLSEAALRLRHPAPVHAGVMMGVAALALVVNGGITLALAGGRRDLNIRSVVIHSLGDAFSSAAILAGALAIGCTGARWLDPLLGMGIGFFVLWSAGGILRESAHVLLEGLPRNVRLEDVADAILHTGGVQEVHDIHIWTLGTDLQALSCHVRIPDMHMDKSERILEQIQKMLGEKFRIQHVTIQFERALLPVQTELLMPEPTAVRENGSP